MNIGKTTIIIDDCPIHKSKEFLNEINKLGWKTMFLSPYSPEYAAIEMMFNLLKDDWYLIVKTK